MTQQGLSGQLFTPYVRPNSTLRAHMELSDVDKAKFDALPPLIAWPAPDIQTVVVHDYVSDLNYEVARAECGSGCVCAAVVIREAE